jgi:hypothetical protein
MSVPFSHIDEQSASRRLTCLRARTQRVVNHRIAGFSAVWMQPVARQKPTVGTNRPTLRNRRAFGLFGSDVYLIEYGETRRNFEDGSPSGI